MTINNPTKNDDKSKKKFVSIIQSSPLEEEEYESKHIPTILSEKYSNSFQENNIPINVNYDFVKEVLDVLFSLQTEKLEYKTIKSINK